MMHTTNEVKLHAANLRDVLAGSGNELNHSRCLEVISKVEGYPDWNTYSAELSQNLQRAEQFMDEILAAEAERNFTKFHCRFEEKYIADATEAEFLREMRDMQEDYGNYIRREFLGCVTGEKLPGDNRYPNLVRYIWRGIFEKNEFVFNLGVYRKGDTYYVAEAAYHG